MPSFRLLTRPAWLTLEVVTAHAIDLRQPAAGQRAQLEHKRADAGIGEPVGDEQASLLGFDQTRAAQDLQVVRGVRHALRDLASDRLDRPWALGEQIENLESDRARGGLADPGDLLVDGRLEADAVRHWSSTQK
jgi:DNA-binding PucR family transcriptional regulator